MSSKGGRETVLASLAEALSPYYEVHILCVTQKNKELAYEFKEGIYYSLLSAKCECHFTCSRTCFTI